MLEATTQTGKGTHMADSQLDASNHSETLARTHLRTEDIHTHVIAHVSLYNTNLFAHSY